MKKGLCLLLVLSMLCGCVMSISATEAPKTDFSKNLITWWNFEGENPYADKAIYGTNADLLVAKNNVTVNGDGTVTVGYELKSYMVADLSEIGAGDLGDLQNKTIVIKVKFDSSDATGTTAVTPFYKVDTARLQMNAKTAYFRTWNPAGGNITNDPYSVSTFDNGYHYFVISYEYSNGVFTEKCYYTQNDQPSAAADFVEMFNKTTENVGDTVCKNDAKNIHFGSSDNNKVMCADMIYDDIKIYNTVLSVDSVLSTFVDNSDSDTITDGVASNLITWWDFDGNDKLADKAVFGNSTDDMTIPEGGDVRLENGTARVSYKAGSYLWAEGSNADLKSLQNKTIVMKFKYDNNDADGNAITGTESSTFIFKSNAYRYQFAEKDSKFSIKTQSLNGTVTKNITSTTKTGFNPVDGSFHYLIISISYVDGTLIEDYYYSTTSAPSKTGDYMHLGHFEHIQDEAGNSLGDVATVTTTSDVFFGKTKTSEVSGADIIYDDVKIYGKAMTIDEAAATVAAPIFRGTQIADNGSTFAVRFVATLDTRMLDEIGFDVTAVANGGAAQDYSQPCTTVYDSINGNTDSGLVEYTAKENFSSNYIFALSIYDIPLSTISSSGKVEFEVTPYSIVNGEKVCYDTVYIKVTYDAQKAESPYVVELNRSQGGILG